MRPSTRMVVLGSRLWRPSVLGSSLALWLDADDASTITLNGSTVSQWRDKSGNGMHATQATAANQPIYNAIGLNTKPVLGFDGTNSFMQAGNTSVWNFMHNGDKYTIIGVWKPGIVGTPGSQVMIALTTSNTSGASGVGQYFAFGDSFGFRYNVTSGGSVSAFVSISRAYTGILETFNSPVIIAIAADPANSTANNRVAVSVNGNTPVLGNTLTGAVTTANSSVPLIIGSIVGSTTNRYIGDLAELLIIKGELQPPSIRFSLEGYLAHKWGLTANLPIDHPFKINPPLA